MKGWTLPLLLVLGAAVQALVVWLVWYDFTVMMNAGPAEAAWTLLLVCWPVILAGGGLLWVFPPRLGGHH